MKMVVCLALVIAVGCGGSTPPPKEPAPLDIAPLPSSSASAVPIVSTPPAERPPPKLDTKRAEELFREAREAFSRGDLELARSKFEESHRFSPAIGTVLNLAEVEVRLGDIPSARRHYEEVLALAKASGQKERYEFAKHRLDGLPK